MEIRRLKSLLKKNKHYITKPRLRLFAVLQKHPALTVNQLILLVPKHDQATVYRNIALFEELGVINRLRLGWLTKIELSDIFQHHHHHFTCINCGKVITLPDQPAIEKNIKSMVDKQGFKAMDHQLEIRGYCPRCKELKRTKSLQSEPVSS